MKSITKTAALNAFGTALYIIIVASTLFYVGNQKFGQQEPNVLIPIFILMLLVFSATITGGLMLGKPILWYLDGRKKEAVSLLLSTIAIFFLITVVTLGLMALRFYTR